MDQHDALELLQPFPKNAVPKTELAEVNKLVDERVNVYIAFPIATAVSGYLLMLMTAFTTWYFHGCPFDLSWPLYLYTTLAATLMIGPSAVDDYLRLTRSINDRLMGSGDAIAAEGLLSDAVATWNDQANLIRYDLAALTPQTTTEERELLFDRAARLIRARRVIEERLAILKKAVQPLPLPPAEIKTYDLMIWSGGAWSNIGPSGPNSNGPK